MNNLKFVSILCGMICSILALSPQHVLGNSDDCPKKMNTLLPLEETSFIRFYAIAELNGKPVNPCTEIGFLADDPTIGYSRQGYSNFTENQMYDGKSILTAQVTDPGNRPLKVSRLILFDPQENSLYELPVEINWPLASKYTEIDINNLESLEVFNFTEKSRDQDLLDLFGLDAPAPNENAVIELNGEPTVVLAVGQTFTDPYASVISGSGLDIEIVRDPETIDFTEPGDYQFSYYAVNMDGAVVSNTVTRTVRILESGESVFGELIISTEPARTIAGLIKLNNENVELNSQIGFFSGTTLIGEYTLTEEYDGHSFVFTSVQSRIDGENNPQISNILLWTPADNKFYQLPVEINLPLEDVYGDVETIRTRVFNFTTELYDPDLAEYLGLVLDGDSVAPDIQLIGEAELEIQAGIPFTDPGATVIDNMDTDIQFQSEGSVDVNTLGTYPIVYWAVDKAGNRSVEITRTVKVVDKVSPEIKIEGERNVNLVVGQNFIDPGASGTDEFEGPVDVSVVGSVNTQRAGVYILEYQAADSSGNSSAKIERRVTVIRGLDLTYEEWILRFIPQGGVNTLPGLDPDEDGYSNEYERISGGNPVNFNQVLSKAP